MSCNGAYPMRMMRQWHNGWMKGQTQTATGAVNGGLNFTATSGLMATALQRRLLQKAWTGARGQSPLSQTWNAELHSALWMVTSSRNGLLRKAHCNRMKLSLTTLFGCLGAAALAVAQVDGITPTLHMVCVCVGAACVAGLGYHASDAKPRPPLPPMVLFVAMLLMFVFTCMGCKVGGLALEVKSPAFGSVGVALDGGMIGKGKMPTNAAPLLSP